MTNNQHSKLQEEFTTAFQNYKKQLNRYSASKLRNADLATDLVQDTFVKTWAYLMKGGKIDAMRAFLYRTLNNLIIDEYRRHKAVSLDDLIDNGYEPVSENDRNEYNSDIFDGHIIVTKIDQLSKKYKQVLTMRYLQNLTISEISSATRQPKNNISVQIHRGLSRLKELTSAGQN